MIESLVANLLPPLWVSILIVAGYNAIITVGLYFSNSAGSLSAAHAAIAGIGGYAGAVITTNLGWPFLLALLAGGVIGFVTGVFLALLTLRMDLLAASLTTFGFGETVVVVALNIQYLGGAEGMFGIPPYTTLTGVSLLLAICMLSAWRFERSRLGYSAYACRDNPVAAAAMGIDVPRVKILVFALGGAVAALGGVMRAHYLQVQSPADLGFYISLNFVIFWAFGGSFGFVGAVFGAVFLTIAPELLRFSIYERYVLYGLLLAVILILRPAGVVPRIALGSRLRFRQALAKREPNERR